MTASKKKSILFVDEINFLGHTIFFCGIESVQTKVDKILAACILSSALDIKEFLSLINYIGQFIPGLSEWSAVLSDFTCKDVKFTWLSPYEKAFLNIKHLAKNHPICKPIDYDKADPVMIVADASNYDLDDYYS